MTPYLLAPLCNMLGIRAGAKVAILNPPPGFVQRLNPLPEGVEFLVTAQRGLDVILFFVTERRELRERLPALARAMAANGAIWVCWPSPAAMPTTLEEGAVRQVALDLGLVDNKTGHLDAVWTGLRLVRSRNPRPEKPERRRDAPLAQA
ncbi:MAG: DUF3052 domain-containing protein [Myxococcaceae bacterium]|nr:DUF3052 domain-containing protein [Myxococcaceae bacterium]MCI0671834.1 DUF3052 domain-containing protein [Myxococcaceae bacterium]